MKKIIVIIITFYSLTAACNSDFLWTTISQECVPNQKKNNQPAPCAEVTFKKDSNQGYVVFKDRNGPLQYLSMPTTKITGIEDPEILTVGALNYFYEAWETRTYMAKKYNAAIPNKEISLAINSALGRSQNQLHIHISCIRPDVQTLIQKNLAAVTESWSLFPGGILGNHYFARRIRIGDLKEKNPFKLLANDLPEAKNHMNEFGLALVFVEDHFILLADRADLLNMDRGHAEEIQDHECPQLYQKH